MTATLRTREHEAGHLLVGRLLRLIDPTSMLALGEDGGWCRGARIPPSWHLAAMTPAEQRTWHEADIVTQLAGIAALRHFRAEDPFVGSDSDQERAIACAKVLEPDDWRGLMNTLLRRGVDLLDQHPEEADRLVAILGRARDRLVGPEVALALDAALDRSAPLPTFDGRREGFEQRDDWLSWLRHSARRATDGL